MWIKVAITVMCVSLMAFANSDQTVAAATGLLLVAEKGTHNLAVVDPSQGMVMASIPEGGDTGHEVAASPDGKLAYVPIYGNSGVGQPGTDGRKLVVIDIAAHKVTNALDFGHGVRPHCAVFGPKDGLLYVTTELDKTVSVIDPNTLTVVGTIPTGQAESHMLALSHDGRRGYTANVGPGTVSVLDLAARKTLAIIPISKQTQRISISMDDRLVFTSDQTQPQLAVIDTSTNQVGRPIALPSLGYASTPTPDGRWLLVALPDTNQVAVVDLKAMKVSRTVDICKAPQAVLVRPDGRFAYVSCSAGHQVAEIGVDEWRVTKTIDTGKGTDGLAWAAQ